MPTAPQTSRPRKACRSRRASRTPGWTSSMARSFCTLRGGTCGSPPRRPATTGGQRRPWTPTSCPYPSARAARPRGLNSACSRDLFFFAGAGEGCPSLACSGTSRALTPKAFEFCKGSSAPSMARNPWPSAPTTDNPLYANLPKNSTSALSAAAATAEPPLRPRQQR
jgi:hypothetical protein